MKEQCCGTCKWHKHESVDDGWICVNPDSEYFADWTEYKDKCEEWEYLTDLAYVSPVRAYETKKKGWEHGSHWHILWMDEVHGYQIMTTHDIWERQKDFEVIGWMEMPGAEGLEAEPLNSITLEQWENLW